MDKTRYTVQAPASFVINKLCQRGFALKKIVKREGSISFTVNHKLSSSLDAVLAKLNVPFSHDYTKGAKTMLKASLSRYGLIIGFVIGLAFLIVYSLSITKVNIQGLKNVNENAILQILDSEHISFPSLMPAIDINRLEIKILSLEGVSGVSISKSGTRLKIAVQEELIKPDIEDTKTPKAVTANYDGMVTRLIVLQGTALVKKGDIVRKGDMLIAPYILDADGNQIELQAIGEVFARVWYQEHSTYADTAIASVRTGESEIRTFIEVFGFTYLPLCSFSSYEYEHSVKEVQALIPYKIVTTTFYKTQMVEVAFDFEEQKEALIKSQTEKLLKKLPDHANGGKSWYIAKRVDNITRLSVYYEVEMKIT